MNNKLQILKEKTGEDFVQIDTFNFKSSKADAIVLDSDDEVAEFIKDTVFLEIPYLDNEFLQRHLPEKFNNNFILEEYKELCKFDHTLLSNLIKDKQMFTFGVIGRVHLTDLVMVDSELDRIGNYWVFYLPHEQ